MAVPKRYGRHLRKSEVIVRICGYNVVYRENNWMY